MSLRFIKAGTSDAPVLNAISKHAFDSDVEVGAPSAGGPPGYGFMSFQTREGKNWAG